MVSDWSYICTLVDYVNIQDIDIRVKDVYNDGIWNSRELATIIPEHIQKEIVKQLFHLNPRINDVYIWKDSVHGEYTAKAGFSWLIKKRLTPLANNNWS